MMEPVAWTTQSQLNLVKELPNDASGHMWGKRDVQDVRDFYEDQTIPEDIPLVRLSDAEARIAELEELAKAFEAEANQMREVSIKNRHRAEAAEALLKEQEADDASLLGKLKVMRGIYAMRKEEYTSRALHNIITEFEASRAARAIHDKIGVKDE